MFAKTYTTIGCCGIDCGLCPRYQTQSSSACPGCGAADFKEKHPSCGFVTCCVNKKELEVCAHCEEYPCKRFKPEKAGYDSFVTHKKVFSNLELIKNEGIKSFIEQQKIRMEVLKCFLERFDERRSKSFFCLSCALLPVETLTELHRFALSLDDLLNVSAKNKILKERILQSADNLKIDLKMNKK